MQYQERPPYPPQPPVQPYPPQQQGQPYPPQPQVVEIKPNGIGANIAEGAGLGLGFGVGDAAGRGLVEYVEDLF